MRYFEDGQVLMAVRSDGEESIVGPAARVGTVIQIGSD